MDNVDEDLIALARDERPFRPQAEDVGRDAYARRMKRIGKEWTEFCLHVKQPVPADGSLFDSPPHLNKVKSFLIWQCRYKKGRLDPKPVLQTVKTLWTEFRLEVARHTGHKYTPKEVADMTKMLELQIKRDEQLSTKARSKPLADGPVVRDVLAYLWTHDEYEYPHPRMRLQLTYAILVLHYHGLRPGELVESSAHCNSNQGIWYGDLEAVAFPDRTGRPRFAIKTTIRNRKGRRDREDLKYGSNVHHEDFMTNKERSQTENLLEEPTMRRMCPVTILIALGIADQVFEDITTPDDLLRVRFQPGQEEIPIRIRPEKKGLPILRRVERAGNLSESKIMTADQLCQYLTKLGWRAGYKENLGTYPFRRGFGNQIDRYVTAAQRRRQMGHKSDDTFMFYISQVSDVHTQAIMNGTEQDQDAVNWLRSMRNKRDLSAPRPEGSSLTDHRFWRVNAIDSA